MAELRTPATIWSRMSSTPGRSGSRYIRDVLMPSSNSSLRARSNAEVEVLLFKADVASDDVKAKQIDKSQALGSQSGKSGSFTVDVPENTETRFVIRGAQKLTKVEAKVKN